MKEVSRLLGIKQLMTTPYHPQCNVLVEKFHFVLKSMLRKLCTERPKDWDRYLPPVLFAYREVPQSSLGFSPFELLYGRTVRGPMTILKELWSNETESPDIKTTYQYIVDLRERLDETCKLAQNELNKSQVKGKKYFDRRSKPREFKAGDQVLVLLPMESNKLLVKWQGPFKIDEVLKNNDYRVKANGKLKTYHAYLLKLYTARDPDEVCAQTNMVIHDGTDLQIKDDSLLAKVAVSVIEHETEIGTIDDLELLDFSGIQPTENYKDVHVNDSLSSQQKNDVGKLLEEFQDIFTDIPGTTHLAEHVIEVSSDQAVRSKPYPIPYTLQETIDEEVEKMLKLEVIRRCDSPYASPIVLVKKKDGSVRFCTDFRKLNLITLFSTEPMMEANQIYRKLKNDEWYSLFDLTKGYWQIPIEKNSQNKTCFVTPNGSYCYLKMAFGLVNAAATFNRMMRKLLKDMKNTDSYVDDVLTHTETWQQHLQELRDLFTRIREAGLTIKPSKCKVGFKSVEFLGHHVGEGQISPNPEKLSVIQEASVPESKKQVRSFLEMVGFFSKFIPNFSGIAAPLSDLTKKGLPNKVHWTNAQEKAFETLKTVLASKPILRLPDFQTDFILQTDASESGIGSVLLQEYEGHKFPVAYASKNLSNREKGYSVIEKECLALLWAVKKFHMYLYGKEFTLETDHQPLVYLRKSKMANGRLMRWSLALQPYQFRIVAIKGSENKMADYLSRM